MVCPIVGSGGEKCGAGGWLRSPWPCPRRRWPPPVLTSSPMWRPAPSWHPCGPVSPVLVRAALGSSRSPPVESTTTVTRGSVLSLSLTIRVTLLGLELSFSIDPAHCCRVLPSSEAWDWSFYAPDAPTAPHRPQASRSGGAVRPSQLSWML